MSESKLQQLAAKKDSIQIAGKGFLCQHSDLYVEDGFNVRDIDKAHLLKMRESWLAGATFPPLQVEVQEDGRLKVIDGHHRYYSYKWASTVDTFNHPAIAIVEFEGTKVEQIALMITSSEGKPLSVLERAGAYYRMYVEGENVTFADIAKAISEGVPHVEKAIKMYEFVDTNEQYKPLVETGIISTNKINKYIANYGEQAASVLSKEIGLDSLDLTPIKKKPDAVALSQEEFDKANEQYKKAIAEIKKQISENSKSVTYKAPKSTLKDSATEAILDVGRAIRASYEDGASTKSGFVTVKLDMALASSILASEIQLSEIEKHNIAVKTNREEMGLDVYDQVATQSSSIEGSVDDEPVESVVDSDVQGDLTDPSLATDEYHEDLNIDPIPDVENESQEYHQG